MAVPALAESSIRHAVFLERLKSGEVRKFDAFLREMDRRLREVLTRDGLGAFERTRTEQMLAEVGAIIAAILLRYRGQLQSDLAELAGYEGEFAGKALADAGFRPNVPTVGQLQAAAFAAPLQAKGADGRPLLAFVDAWAASEREALVGAVRVGVAQGQTTAQVVKALRGTKAQNYADGALAITKRHAESVVRTAVQHVGDVSRLETYKANADIVKGEQWVATLDSRTTVQCMALDGRVFELDKGPRPPIHINCRSVRIPVLADEFKFLTKGEMRSSKDGPVPASLNYYQWLKSQPAAFQNEALGPTRADLFRNGGLSADRFAALQLDRNFQPLTLDEMKKLEPLAFNRAGL